MPCAAENSKCLQIILFIYIVLDYRLIDSRSSARYDLLCFLYRSYKCISPFYSLAITLLHLFRCRPDRRVYNLLLTGSLHARMCLRLGMAIGSLFLIIILKKKKNRVCKQSLRNNIVFNKKIQKQNSRETEYSTIHSDYILF